MASTPDVTYGQVHHLHACGHIQQSVHACTQIKIVGNRNLLKQTGKRKNSWLSVTKVVGDLSSKKWN